MEKKLFLIHVWGDVEPTLKGPYKSEESRDRAAKRLRKKEGEDHGIFKLTTEAPAGVKTRHTVGTYSGGFFDEEDEA